MRLGTIAFLLGIVCLQNFNHLPDPRWLWLFPLLVLPILRYARLRFPLFMVMGFLWALFQAHAVQGLIIPKALEGVDLWVEGVIDSVPQRLEQSAFFLENGSYRTPVPISTGTTTPAPELVPQRY